MTVTSPFKGFGLSLGIYCLTANERTSSWVWLVALEYSRICDDGVMCSLMINVDSMVGNCGDAAMPRRDESSRFYYNE